MEADPLSFRPRGTIPRSPKTSAQRKSLSVNDQNKKKRNPRKSLSVNDLNKKKRNPRKSLSVNDLDKKEGERRKSSSNTGEPPRNSSTCSSASPAATASTADDVCSLSSHEEEEERSSCSSMSRDLEKLMPIRRRNMPSEVGRSAVPYPFLPSDLRRSRNNLRHSWHPDAASQFSPQPSPQSPPKPSPKPSKKRSSQTSPELKHLPAAALEFASIVDGLQEQLQSLEEAKRVERASLNIDARALGRLAALDHQSSMISDACNKMEESFRSLRSIASADMLNGSLHSSMSMCSLSPRKSSSKHDKRRSKSGLSVSLHADLSAELRKKSSKEKKKDRKSKSRSSHSSRSKEIELSSHSRRSSKHSKKKKKSKRNVYDSDDSDENSIDASFAGDDDGDIDSDKFHSSSKHSRAGVRGPPGRILKREDSIEKGFILERESSADDIFALLEEEGKDIEREERKKAALGLSLDSSSHHSVRRGKKPPLPTRRASAPIAPVATEDLRKMLNIRKPKRDMSFRDSQHFREDIMPDVPDILQFNLPKDPPKTTERKESPKEMASIAAEDLRKMLDIKKPERDMSFMDSPHFRDDDETDNPSNPQKELPNETDPSPLIVKRNGGRDWAMPMGEYTERKKRSSSRKSSVLHALEAFLEEDEPKDDIDLTILAKGHAASKKIEERARKKAEARKRLLDEMRYTVH